LKFQDSGPALALETTAGASLLNGLGVVNFPAVMEMVAVGKNEISANPHNRRGFFQ